MLAEYDNFRKRTAAEKTSLYNNAVADTVKEILPIADNIQRALSQENASAEDMKRGVEMIESQIEACFEKLGLEAMGGSGGEVRPQLPQRRGPHRRRVPGRERHRRRVPEGL